MTPKPTTSEAESRAVAEAARQAEWKSPSFLRELFLGGFRLDLIYPFPGTEEGRPEFNEFFEKLRAFLREHVDPVALDAEEEYPREVVDGLKKLGAFGLKVPKARERCWMRVGDARCEWGEGEIFFFDDSYPHEVHNDTDEERAVLLFDFERPMTLRGRLVGRTLMRLLRRSAYFKDALRNQEAWEERFRASRAAEGRPARSEA